MDVNDIQSLSKFARNVTSQTGEDGIIEKIFEVIEEDEDNRWCVEFGAWDGVNFSNTHNLIKNYNWSAVLIEADKLKFKNLGNNYNEYKNAFCINRFVEFEGENTLDNILMSTPISKKFDLLSIDIDGNDIHVWDSVKHHNPKVVVIEYNPTIPNEIEFVQPRDMKINQGSSLRSIVKLGAEKGYELVATTELNAFFVRREYFGLFSIEDNSVDKIRPYSEYESYIFQLFDGTLVLRGNTKLCWHGIDIRQDKIQVIPYFLRHLFTDSFFKKVLYKVWVFFYKRGVF